MEAASFTWRPLGRLLVEQGLLSHEELVTAIDEQEQTGRRLGEILVERGYVSAAALAAALAEQFGIKLSAGDAAPGARRRSRAVGARSCVSSPSTTTARRRSSRSR